MKQKLPFEKMTLPNGVRLMLIPMDGVNSVATSVMVGVGSRFETPEINGISHFLEHMVFKGTKKYPTTEDVNTIERAGGLQNAYTDIDITNYHNKVLSTDWSLALDINRELATEPLLEQKHVDKERDVIIEEMKRYEDEPAAKVGETFHEMLYPGTKLGMPIIGKEKSLRSVASKELKTYHGRWYTPDRMVVVLAGNIKDQSSHIKKKTEEWFAPLEAGSAEEAESVIDHQTEPKVEVVTKPDVQQAHLILGIRAFNRDNEDRYAWNLFNLIMGVSFTSRLFKEIREKRGLCYHIRSSADNWKDVGYWSIYAGVATAKVAETLQAIIYELSKVVARGVTNAEVAVAKKRLKTMLAFKSEDPEFLNEFYGRQELFGQKLITLPEYIAKIEAITKKDIDILLPRYIRQETLNLAVVWNKPKDEKLVTFLKI
ncbi:MAG: pitrilysin family protein [Candidatus Gottesmanbacteria bacterium]|nr:pitrilysin family protein [Candidatus Gottesmanbacteria bacterium]